jgi:Undecaprenyl-phosphate glucose phosphotransferase
MIRPQVFRREGRAAIEPPQSAALAWSAAQEGARSLSSSGNPVQMLAGAVAVLDCGVVLAASMAAFCLRHGIVWMPLDIGSTTLFAMILMFNLSRGIGYYDRPPASRSFMPFGRAASAWTAVFGILIVLGFLTKLSDEFSRTWAIAWYSLGLLGFAVVRLSAVRVSDQAWQRGRSARTVAIVDLAGSGDALAREINRSHALDTRLAGLFYPTASPSRRNGIEDLTVLSRLFRIDEVIVSVQRFDQEELPAILATLAMMPTTVRLYPNMPRSALSSVQAELFLDELMITVQQRPLSGLNGWAKRLEDLVLCVLILVGVAPLLVLIAAAIWLESPGPVLFRQRRVGFNNNVFTVYKFRTMRVQSASDTVVPQAQRQDPRVTRVGRFLRRTSLDELPQLLNVLQGNMSLVGPRPHAVAHNDKYAALIDGYCGRHRVQPGITGWAQISGYRGETDTLDKMAGRVKHDLAYIENWSILLDLKIIAKTAIFAPFDSRAY